MGAVITAQKTWSATKERWGLRGIETLPPADDTGDRYGFPTMEKYDVAKASQVSERLSDRQGAEQRAVVEFLSLFKNFERQDGRLRVILRSDHDVELRWAPDPPVAGITTERVVALRWGFGGLRASRRKEVDRLVHSLGDHMIELSYDVARDAIVPSEPHPHDALTFTMIEVWKLLEELR